MLIPTLSDQAPEKDTNELVSAVSLSTVLS